MILRSLSPLFLFEPKKKKKINKVGKNTGTPNICISNNSSKDEGKIIFATTGKVKQIDIQELLDPILVELALLASEGIYVVIE